MRRIVSDLNELLVRDTQGILTLALEANPPQLAQFGTDLEFIGLSGNAYVYKQRVHVGLDDGRRIFAYAKLSDRPQIVITGGAATVQFDEFNGAVLITPSTAIPVTASVQQLASLNSREAQLVGPPQNVGINVDLVPISQLMLAAAGGGACRARWSASMPLDFDVNVRASVLADVRPTSETVREIDWRHGRYFAHHPQLGLMSLFYDQDKASVLRMQSLQQAGDFFPASAENSINFVCEFVDLGITAKSRRPMNQTVSTTDWPPYRNTVLSISEPLEFYDVKNPDRLVMTILSQEMYLYDYNSIEVESISSSYPSPNMLTTRWRISNLSDDLVYGRWFLLGDFTRDARFPSEGNQLLASNGSDLSTLEFDVTVPVEQAAYVQKISMNVVNVREAIYSGAATLQFSTPS